MQDLIHNRNDDEPQEFLELNSDSSKKSKSVKSISPMKLSQLEKKSCKSEPISDHTGMSKRGQVLKLGKRAKNTSNKGNVKKLKAYISQKKREIKEVEKDLDGVKFKSLKLGFILSDEEES